MEGEGALITVGGLETFLLTQVGDLYCAYCRKITFDRKFVNARQCRWCLMIHGYEDYRNQQKLFHNGKAINHVKKVVVI